MKDEKRRDIERTLKEIRVRHQMRTDGGEGSGFKGHAGVPGKVGGSAPKLSTLNKNITDAYATGMSYKVVDAVRDALKKAPANTKITMVGYKKKKETYHKTGENEFWKEIEKGHGKYPSTFVPADIENMLRYMDASNIENRPKISSLNATKKKKSSATKKKNSM